MPLSSLPLKPPHLVLSSLHYTRAISTMGLRIPPIIIIMMPLLVIMYNFECAEQLSVQNQRKIPIYVCTNAANASGPMKLDTNELKPLPAANVSSLILWGKLDSSDCIIDTQNPTAKTVAVFNFGNEDVSYSVSAENGYNFGISIRPMSATDCDTISCVGDLEGCPHELKSYENGVIVGCKAPEDCSDQSAARLCAEYLSAGFCQTPDGSPYDPSGVSSTCSAASVELLAGFMGD